MGIEQGLVLLELKCDHSGFHQVYGLAADSRGKVLQEFKSFLRIGQAGAQGSGIFESHPVKTGNTYIRTVLIMPGFISTLTDRMVPPAAFAASAAARATHTGSVQPRQALPPALTMQSIFFIHDVPPLQFPHHAALTNDRAFSANPISLSL